MVKNNISENIEEYLEVLYRQGRNKNQVSNKIISEELGIAPGSVTQMLKKLENLGYINYESYKGATLTDNGMKIGQLIIRKHTILELLLTDILKIKQENVHEQACDMEHALSDEALKSLCLMLHQPDSNSASKLIPACNLKFKNCLECSKEIDFDNVNYRKKSLLAISELINSVNSVVAFIRGNEEIYAEINSLGIRIGSKIEFRDVDGNITTKFDGREIKLSSKFTNNIFIEI